MNGTFPGVAGALFGAGWWCFVDAIVYSKAILGEKVREDHDQSNVTNKFAYLLKHTQTWRWRCSKLEGVRVLYLPMCAGTICVLGPWLHCDCGAGVDESRAQGILEFGEPLLRRGARCECWCRNTAVHTCFILRPLTMILCNG